MNQCFHRLLQHKAQSQYIKVASSITVTRKKKKQNEVFSKLNGATERPKLRDSPTKDQKWNQHTHAHGGGGGGGEAWQRPPAALLYGVSCRSHHLVENPDFPEYMNIWYWLCCISGDMASTLRSKLFEQLGLGTARNPEIPVTRVEHSFMNILVDFTSISIVQGNRGRAKRGRLVGFIHSFIFLLLYTCTGTCVHAMYVSQQAQHKNTSVRDHVHTV